MNPRVSHLSVPSAPQATLEVSEKFCRSLLPALGSIAQPYSVVGLPVVRPETLSTTQPDVREKFEMLLRSMGLADASSPLCFTKVHDSNGALVHVDFLDFFGKPAASSIQEALSSLTQQLIESDQFCESVLVNSACILIISEDQSNNPNKAFERGFEKKPEVTTLVKAILSQEPLTHEAERALRLLVLGCAVSFLRYGSYLSAESVVEFLETARQQRPDLNLHKCGLEEFRECVVAAQVMVASMRSSQTFSYGPSQSQRTIQLEQNLPPVLKRLSILEAQVSSEAFVTLTIGTTRDFDFSST